MQTAVKEMVDSLEHDQIAVARPSSRATPHVVHVHQIVLVALHDEPGTARIDTSSGISRPHGWCNRDESRDQPRRAALAAASRVSHEGPEGKSREPELATRHCARGPIADGTRIVGFSRAIIEYAVAAADAAKIEAHRGEPMLLERARDRVRDLVVHGSAVQRMRVADDRRAPADRSPQARLRVLRAAPTGPAIMSRCGGAGRSAMAGSGAASRKQQTIQPRHVPAPAIPAGRPAPAMPGRTA